MKNKRLFSEYDEISNGSRKGDSDAMLNLGYFYEE
jgi:hypothetical protein